MKKDNNETITRQSQIIPIKRFVKGLFKAAGLEISKIQRSHSAPSVLVHHQIELVFDVGANVGQYGMLVRNEGYQGRIVSFEPLPEAHELLTQNTKSDPLWTIHKRCAVGAKSGEADLNISKNSESSSLRSMLHAHYLAAPESIYVGKAKAEIITLDSVFERYRQRNEKTFVKIDTQGFETEVLSGLTENLKNIFAVQIELSVVPLYENQNVYSYFLDFFEKTGFVLWTLIPGFYNPSTGQLLQFDAIFVRRSYAP